MNGHGEKSGREGFYIRRVPSILAGICLDTFLAHNQGSQFGKLMTQNEYEDDTADSQCDISVSREAAGES
jgi:hypothetical protein